MVQLGEIKVFRGRLTGADVAGIPQPDGVTIQVVRKVLSWQVCAPVVYRYMDKEFVDQFFDTGELRLSSVRAFRRHSDEQRGDTAEGQSILVSKGPSSTVVAAVGRDRGAYILSTSLRNDDQLAADFNASGRFEITRPHQFALAVGDSIEGFVGGFEGYCAYRDTRSITAETKDVDLDALKDENGKLPLDKVFQLATRPGGPMEFLLKLKKYQHQQEYRFVWSASGSQDHVIVNCPKASQFCRRVGD